MRGMQQADGAHLHVCLVWNGSGRDQLQEILRLSWGGPGLERGWQWGPTAARVRRVKLGLKKYEVLAKCRGSEYRRTYACVASVRKF